MPSYMTWMHGKCLRCGKDHMVKVCPVAKDEEDRSDEDKATVKAFKAEAKAVKAARKKWIADK
jgi:hypothetical protein